MTGLWLVLPDHSRLRVSPSGVLVGRDPACDVRLVDPAASRHHALVRLAGEDAVLVALGRHPTRVRGDEVRGTVPLADGDVIEVPGLALRVELGDAEGARWVVRTAQGPPLALRALPFRVGAGGDLAPPGWPAGALVIEARELELLRGRSAVPLVVDSARVGPGATTLRPGARVAFDGGAEVVFDHDGQLEAATTATHGRGTEIVLQLLPEGGRLLVRIGGGELGTWLPERRFALISALLDAPGEYVDDDLLCARVWPRQTKSRVDLNVLIGRARKDLAEAGLDPAILERAPGGGGTRLRVPPRARVRRV